MSYTKLGICTYTCVPHREIITYMKQECLKKRGTCNISRRKIGVTAVSPSTWLGYAFFPLQDLLLWGRDIFLLSTSQLSFVTLSPDVIHWPSRELCDYLNEKERSDVCILTKALSLLIFLLSL